MQHRMIMGLYPTKQSPTFGFITRLTQNQLVNSKNHTAMAVDNFPVFVEGADQGLVKLDSGDPFYTNTHYDKMITAFDVMAAAKQPPFLITRESWALLAQGLHRDSTGITVSWMDKLTYEVYAFVFCVAFRQNNQLPNAYFRVRTILKKIEEKGDGVHMPVFVETDNIAYVDLDTAISNQRYPTDPQQNCLRFIDKNDFTAHPATKRMKDNIDHETIRKYGDPDYNASIIPVAFKPHDISIIKNEGAIFGKYRIWDDLLVKDYHLNKDTLIYLTWNEATHEISFDFKINNAYASRIQCPPPGVCKLQPNSK